MALVLDGENIEIEVCAFQRTARLGHVTRVASLEHDLKCITIIVFPFEEDMNVRVLDGEGQDTDVRVGGADCYQVESGTIIQLRHDEFRRQGAIRSHMVKMEVKFHHRISRLNLPPPT